MFAFEVRYLMRKAFAGDYSNRGESEWPPHPARFYSALVAACYQTGMGEAGEAALHWLERQGPAHISAESAGECVPYTGFVPTNYVDKNGIHTKQPRAFPAAIPKDDLVYFIWPDALPNSEVRTALYEMSARVGYLGRSASFVQVRVADAPPPATYVPAPTGDLALRVPTQGRLDELKRLYATDRWDPYTSQQCYRRVTSPPLQGRHAGFWADMIVLRRKSGYAFTSEATLTVTQMLRDALMSQAGQEGRVPNILQGHEGAQHCAFVALPFVGYEHADGHLLGCALLLPRGCGPDDFAAVRRAVAKLENAEINFKRPHLATWRIEIAARPTVATTLRISSWKGPAREWHSVTPVLLDRFPKRALPVEEIINRSCERVGLPRPLAVSHGPSSTIPGVPPVSAFRLLRNKADRPRWGVHVKLLFGDEVPGPMVLGAGRYFGLGLMRPGGSHEIG